MKNYSEYIESLDESVEHNKNTMDETIADIMNLVEVYIDLACEEFGVDSLNESVELDEMNECVKDYLMENLNGEFTEETAEMIIAYQRFAEDYYNAVVNELLTESDDKEEDSEDDEEVDEGFGMFHKGGSVADATRAARERRTDAKQKQSRYKSLLKKAARHGRIVNFKLSKAVKKAFKKGAGKKVVKTVRKKVGNILGRNIPTFG